MSRGAAGEWAAKLLPLPDVLRGVGDGSLTELGDALMTTGHFLTHWMAAELGNKPLPASRERLIHALQKKAIS